MIVKKISNWLLASAAAVAVPIQSAFAALPTSTAPAGATAGDWSTFISASAKQYLLVLGLILAVIALLWVGYGLVTKLNEVRNGRAEYGELAAQGVAGAMVLGILLYLANAASTVI